MYNTSLRYLRCPSCHSKLEVEIFNETDEINEGFLRCLSCKLTYPVISSVAIIVEDLTEYFSIRPKLGGCLMLNARNQTLKNFIKNSLKKTKVHNDTTQLEKNWAEIYQKNHKSSFYDAIKNMIKKLSTSELALEHGCSIGIVSEQLSTKCKYVFGIDKSFFAIQKAKMKKIKNCDFLVADSLLHPFGKQKFDVVIALNMLELVEPQNLLEIVSKQTKKFLFVSDPYDYERGKDSVKERWDEKILRNKITSQGFSISRNTRLSNYVSWNLKINSRLELRYKVDVVLAKRH